MTATQQTSDLLRRLHARSILASFEQAQTLRRAEKTLHRWAELECGDGNDYASWAIERDEETDVPYMCMYPHRSESYRHRIPDREAGALRRVEDVCRALGAHFYHQTDPRGCALYVSTDPLSGTAYTNGVACCD